MTKIDLKGLPHNKLEDFFLTRGEKKFRAKQLLTWLYHKFETDFENMTDLPTPLRAKLTEDCYVSRLEIADKQKSHDGAVKYLFKLEDGETVESVLIPDKPRLTVCLSTQVGCSLGCKFCATGQMGFIRNLKASEIVNQLEGIKLDQGETNNVTNVVLMGMGEPLLNTENVLDAIDNFNSELGYEIGARKITISTVGIPKEIEKLAALGLKERLAISLNAPSQKLRDDIMPGVKKFPIKSLIKPIEKYAESSARWVTLEYIMLKGVNDSLSHASELIEFTKDLPVKVNLIQYNPVEGIKYESSELRDLYLFQAYLLENGITTTIRKSKGQDIAAACGQLRTEKIKATGTQSHGEKSKQ
ncbi:23S rRNA (adenine(2503)-C(2))-methyltransferase RlmN [bacterium]|nr:23S rRNA (adenine(2503)-C(2))-methyltransferase RlmN [bacterium]